MMDYASFLLPFTTLLLAAEMHPAPRAASAGQPSMKSQPANNPVKHADFFGPCESRNKLPCFLFFFFVCFFFSSSSMKLGTLLTVKSGVFLSLLFVVSLVKNSTQDR